jgi:FtsH-binding integral membrane protein
MTMESSATHFSDADLQSPAKSSFAKVFGIGVAGWILGTLGVFLVSWITAHPDSIPSAFMWTMSRWWIGFACGLVLMVGYGLSKKLSVGRPMMAYSLPVLVLMVLASLCLAVYPDSGFRIEFSTYLPLVLMFHVLGLLWISLSRDGEERSAFARAVLPSLVGGLIILGFVAVPVFTGDAFRYRDAFKFTISKAAVVNGEIRSEGTIEIRKPGNYEFVAPRYSFAEYLSSGDADLGLDVGTITWGSAGAPTAGKTGVFPLQIVWRKGVLPATFTTLPEYENEVFLDVCDADDSNRGIYFLAAPLKNQ